ncbi:MAG: Ig-like domain-containing protein [Gammaproteobacteria bacterium]|nr:Ig-like domain-containing protein [Gammaproteobacteria bacterium]
MVVSPSGLAFSALGDTATLTATVKDAAGHTVADAAVTWASSDPGVATVAPNGLVTAMGNGSATVTAAAGPVSDSVTVIVQQVPASVEVSPSELTFVALGDTASLTATAYDATGHTVADTEVTWAGSDPGVAMVTANGLVEAVGNGSATITATAGPVLGSATVTVHQVPASVEVSPSELTFVALGDTASLTAMAYDATGHTVADAEVTWASSDPAVATVAANGLVAAVGNGTALVTATFGSVSGQATVRVESRAENTDREALVALYEATDGDNWTENANWLSDRSLGDWHGVDTDQHDRVVAIELSGNALAGPIPSELGSLEGLKVLSLDWNSLEGTIPPRLGSLAKLEVLRLGGNQLTGPIPPEIGNLASLTQLSLFLSDFTGPIPPELGNLRRLTHLDLIDTDLVGIVPPTLIGLPLTYFGWDSYEGLCMPGTPAFADWVAGIEQHRGGWEWEDYCNWQDRTALESLYRAAGGDGWTRSTGWIDGEVPGSDPLPVPALGRWHGITAEDSLGRVTEIDLADNGLSGELSLAVGDLGMLTALRLGGNPSLSGFLPHTLPRLSALREFRYAGTDLCVPAEEFIRRWLNALEVHEGTDEDCAPTADREVLRKLYNATGGERWFATGNWFTDAPLRDWHGVDADGQGRVVGLDLSHNGLVGAIPPEIVGLDALASLALAGNDLSGGPIPPELGALVNLEFLDLAGILVSGTIPSELGSLTRLLELDISGNELSGGIPPALANLSKLTHLDLADNGLTGPIPARLAELSTLEQLHLEGNGLWGPLPAELADLPELWILDLSGNAVSESIPAAFGEFAKLEYLNLSYNELSGSVPPELARIASLTELFLGSNRLSGPIPPDFGDLVRLRSLALTGNAEMSGPLPARLANLRELSHFHAAGTNLCAPPDQVLLAWLDALLTRRVRRCDVTPAAAYLTQAAQSLELPVALVAGEEALLRVFPTAARANSERIPRVRAAFYLGGSLAHSVDIPAKPGPIPTGVDEGSLARSANAPIPAEIIQPGLEMVIDIDPEGTLDRDLGVARRIPETGRLAVEVRAMPLFDITFIPFLWEANPDSAVIDLTTGMQADPAGHPMLRPTRTLLPVGDLTVTAHAPVVSSSNEASNLIGQVQAIRAIEGGGGYYMGLLSGESSGAAGIGDLGRRTAYSVTSSSVIAHEFGHNLSLQHTPCGRPAGVDPAYPYADASPGIWGYDFREGGRLVSPTEYKDLMSYCEPYWVSDFSFDKALRYRLHSEGLLGAPVVADARPVPSLLVWGGVDSLAVPYLNPAFVVEAPPTTPLATGSHRITGHSRDGGELFSLSFAMPRAEDGNGGSSFAFAVPAPSAWAGELASITLSGPGGSATLDTDHDRPMVIVRDRASGQVTGFLDDSTAAVAGTGAAHRVLFSRGIPDPGAWGR